MKTGSSASQRQPAAYMGRTRPLRRFLVMALATGALLMTSCGGGGSDASGNAPAATGAEVRGYAVLDHALAYEKLTLRDATGRTFIASTAVDGSFVVSADDLTFPVLLRVQTESTDASQVQMLYAVLDAKPDQPVWISSVTTAVVAALSVDEPEVLFESLGVSATSRQAVTSARIDTVEAAVRSQLTKAGSADAVTRWLANTGRIALATIPLDNGTIADLVSEMSHVLAQTQLSLSARAGLPATAVGCDVPSQAVFSDSSPRPACAGGSDVTLSGSVTYGGSMRPVAADHPTDATGWADMLAGVGRERNWKTLDSTANSAALQPGLRVLLRDWVSDAWSGGKGYQFPGSYGIGDGPVDALVSSIIDLNWDRLPKKLKVDEVSNLSFAYQRLRRVLADPDLRQGAFSSYSRVDAVRLAAPGLGMSLAPTLDFLSDDTKAFAQAWLGDAANRQAGSVPASVQAVGDLWIAMTELSGQTTFATIATEMQSLNVQMQTAASQLPPSAADLVAPAKAMGQWFVDFAANCLYPLSLPYSQQAAYDLPCQYAIAQEATVLAAMSTNYANAVQASSSTPETASAFYDRFIAALASHITEEYEQHFDRHDTAIESIYGSATFVPITLMADLYDGFAYTTCCLSSAERTSPRAVEFYVADGGSVQFVTDPDGKTNPQQTRHVPILRYSFTAPPLDALAGVRLGGPYEVAMASSTRAAVLPLVCASADRACMARLARSRVDDMRTEGGWGPDYEFGLQLLVERIMKNGGLGWPGWMYVEESELISPSVAQTTPRSAR